MGIVFTGAQFNLQWVHAVNDAWTSIASECHVNNSQSNDATAITINWKNIQCGKDGNLTAIQQTENADPNCATSQTFQAIQKNFSQQLAALEQQANAPPDLTLSVGAVQINASVAVLTNKVMAEMTTLCDSGNAQSNVGRDITMNGDDLSCDTLQGVSQSSSSGAKCAMSVYAGVLQSNKVLQKATMGSSTNQWWTILIVAGIAAAVLGTIVGVVEYLQSRKQRCLRAAARAAAAGNGVSLAATCAKFSEATASSTVMGAQRGLGDAARSTGLHVATAGMDTVVADASASAADTYTSNRQQQLQLRQQQQQMQQVQMQQMQQQQQQLGVPVGRPPAAAAPGAPPTSTAMPPPLSTLAA